MSSDSIPLDFTITDLRTRAERRRQPKLDKRKYADTTRHAPRTFAQRYALRANQFTFRQIKNVLTRFPKRIRGIQKAMENEFLPGEKKMQLAMLGRRMAIAIDACVAVLKARNYGAAPARPPSVEAQGRIDRRDGTALRKSVMDEIQEVTQTQWDMLAEGGPP